MGMFFWSLLLSIGMGWVGWDRRMESRNREQEKEKDKDKERIKLALTQNRTPSFPPR